MNNLLIGVIIYSILIFLLIYKSEIKTSHDEFISQDTTKYLKGFSIVIIAIHHFSLHNNIRGIMFPFTKVGYLGVSIFLFLSGYGIAKSYEKIGLNRFWIKRLSRVYIPFVIINFITLILYNIVLKKNYSYRDVLEYIIGIRLIDPILWYVKAILFLYLCFYILIKYMKKNNAIKVLLCISIFYPIVCYFINLGSEWYTASFSFFIGIVMVFYKSRIDRIILPRYKYYLILASCLFIIFSSGNIFFNKVYSLKVVFCYFSSILFTCLVLLIIYKIKLSNKPVLFIGVISYEIYLIHMKVYNILFINSTSNGIILYLIIIILLSFIFNKLNSMVNRRIK